MWHDVVDGMLLDGHNHLLLFGLDIPCCKARCVSEDTFTCMSFDFYHNFNVCYLSEETVETQPNNATYSNYYSYGERNLDCIGVYLSTN